MSSAPAGPTIRDRRKLSGLTLEALSCASGVSYPLTCRLDRGLAALTLPVAERLAPVLGTSVAELLDAQATLHEQVRADLICAAAAGERREGVRPGRPSLPRTRAEAARMVAGERSSR